VSEGGRRGRRRSSSSLLIIKWRDIPAQVTASAAGHKHSQVLDERFQHAIDRAAAVAGLTETQAYVGEWQREVHPLEGDAATAAARLVDELHVTYDHDHLERLVRSGGVATDLSTTDELSSRPTTGHDT
jgi:hypothetical protein